MTLRARTHSPAIRFGLPALAAIIALALVPRVIAGRDASYWFDGDIETTDALARDVAADVMRDARAEVPGGGTLAGEWTLVADQMAILGLGQWIASHPEFRGRYLPVMDHAAARMMLPRQRAFATRAWGHDGLVALESDSGDAWLGWPALALSVIHRLDPTTRFAALDDRIADALARRLGRAPHGLIETYPGQSFPTDVAACIAAVAVNARARGLDRTRLLSTWAATLRARWIDRRSGFLWQQGDWQHGTGRDAPRGSATAVAAYFLSFVDAALTRELVDGLERNERSLLGFGAIREYEPGHAGRGDVDSGPVVLGVSIAATGFTLGAARAVRRRSLFVDLYRTTRLFGVPAARGGNTRFATGGRFGNAVMLAQLTAGWSP